MLALVLGRIVVGEECRRLPSRRIPPPSRTNHATVAVPSTRNLQRCRQSQLHLRAGRCVGRKCFASRLRCRLPLFGRSGGTFFMVFCCMGGLCNRGSTAVYTIHKNIGLEWSQVCEQRDGNKYQFDIDTRFVRSFLCPFPRLWPGSTAVVFSGGAADGAAAISPSWATPAILQLQITGRGPAWPSKTPWCWPPCWQSTGRSPMATWRPSTSTRCAGNSPSHS